MQLPAVDPAVPARLGPMGLGINRGVGHVDTLAFVRQQLWPVSISWMSPEEADMVKIPEALLARLSDALAYAA